VAALTAVFVTIAQHAGSRISEQIGLDPTPAASAGGTQTARAFSTAVRLDIGVPPEQLALPQPLTAGPELHRLMSGEVDHDLGAFLDRNHGAPVANLAVAVTLTGHRSPSVLINSIEIRKMSTSPSMMGTQIIIGSEGEVAAVPLRVDLDQASQCCATRPGRTFRRRPSR